MPAEAHGIARDLFHSLTDRVGQAVVSLDISYETWPDHRFYFTADPADLDRLLSILTNRKDVVEVTESVPAIDGPVIGLFARAQEAGYSAVLVAHETHDGH